MEFAECARRIQSSISICQSPIAIDKQNKTMFKICSELELRSVYSTTLSCNVVNLADILDEKLLQMQCTPRLCRKMEHFSINIE